MTSDGSNLYPSYRVEPDENKVVRCGEIHVYRSYEDGTICSCEKMILKFRDASWAKNVKIPESIRRFDLGS